MSKIDKLYRLPGNPWPAGPAYLPALDNTSLGRLCWDKTEWLGEGEAEGEGGYRVSCKTSGGRPADSFGYNVLSMQGLVEGLAECTNLIYVSGYNQVTFTKFTRPNIQM